MAESSAVSWVNRRPMLVAHVDPQWMPRSVLIPGWKTAGQGVIQLAHFMPLKLHAQSTMGCGGARHHQDAGSNLVQPMHNPYAPQLGLKQLQQIL